MQTLNTDIDSYTSGGGMGGMANNPLLWLITLGFLKGGNLLGGGEQAGVLAGQTQSKLDCLQQGHAALSQQLAGQTEAQRFMVIGDGINGINNSLQRSVSELAGIQRDATAALTGQINDARSEAAKCCCETQIGLERVRNDVANQTSVLLAAGLKNTQDILDKMCHNQISTLAAENARLLSELNKSEIISALSKKA